MKGGFPDGALGRWRTLNEIAVVAHFLAGQDKARYDNTRVGSFCAHNAYYEQ